MDQNYGDCCAICSKQPEDMLLLECSHNLCLDCATELFKASQQQSLQCEICFVLTLLDKQTINCLSSLAMQTCNVASRRQEPIVPKPPKEVRGLQCFQHKQKALYYCFDCQNGNICSECILGTLHSGHKVLTVKKATKILAEHLIANSKELEQLKTKIEEDSEWIRLKKDDLTNELANRQNKLKLIFDDMLRQVAGRYNELSTELERTSMRGIQIFDGSLNSLNEKLALIEQTLQQNALIVQQNDSQAILRRFTQLELQKENYQPDLPSNLPQNFLSLNHEDAAFVELETLLQKLTWQNSTRNQIQKENRPDIHNMMRYDPSLLEESRQKLQYPDFVESHLREKELNQSLNKYSGIKMSSRRLQLSRSMDNATNIINKLQERIRK